MTTEPRPRVFFIATRKLSARHRGVAGVMFIIQEVWRCKRHPGKGEDSKMIKDETGEWI